MEPKTELFPQVAATGLAHLILTILYKQEKIQWEIPVKMIQVFSPHTVLILRNVEKIDNVKVKMSLLNSHHKIPFNEHGNTAFLKRFINLLN